jgi:hypothetical protein
MAKFIQVSKSYIKLVSNKQVFYIGSKHFDALIKAIETAKIMPEGSVITLKIDFETEGRTKEEEEELAEEEEEELAEEEEEEEEEELEETF